VNDRALLVPGEPVRDPGDRLTLAGLRGLLTRRAKLFWIPTLAVTVAGLVAAALLPERFVAQAVLAVEPAPRIDAGDEAPEAPPAEEQLGHVREILLERSLLEQVAAETGLFEGAGDGLAELELAAMRARVRLRAEGPTTFSIGYEDGDARRSTTVAKRLSELLLERNRAEREARARESAGLAEERLAALGAQLAAHERRLESYRQRWFLELPEQVPSTLALLEDAQERLQAGSAVIAEQRARLSALHGERAGLERRGHSLDPGRSRLDELVRERDELARRYTSLHPERIRIEAEIAALESGRAGGAAVPAGGGELSQAQMRLLTLDGELDAARSRLVGAEVERGGLRQTVAELERRLAAAPRHEAALAEIEREHDAAEAQYLAMAGRLEDARLRQSVERARQGSYRLVSEPRVPTAPVSPNRPRVALLGLLAGLGLGLASALLVEQSDTSYRGVEDFRAPAGPPVLAAIPWRLERPNLLLSGPPAATDSVAVLDEPYGATAEQYRILAARLLGRARSAQPISLMVTSPAVAEGKTTAAVNLAFAFSRMITEESVLLVDADFGRRSATRRLGLPGGPGLSSLLERPEGDLGRCVRRYRGIYVLGAGEASPAARSALGSVRAERLFQRLRRTFSCVIVDAPPVLAVAESMLLQRLVDSVVMVVRARATPRELVRRALENIDTGRLAGFVLTDVDGVPVDYPYSSPGSEPDDEEATA
jgi:uncharacterized protein involved in exopolysaccharide biosynthesis/Mrp family chromosome partitioning ATPase